jgi:hypothetical protein
MPEIYIPLTDEEVYSARQELSRLHGGRPVSEYEAMEHLAEVAQMYESSMEHARQYLDEIHELDD